MATNPARRITLGVVLGSMLALSGCANSGPLASRRGMMGTLKTSVAQLDGDNQNLRRELAELKADNARVEDQLFQAQAKNGEITARLDDAKELISRQSGDSNALGRGTRSSFEEEIPPPVKTINRSNRRPPPAASIPRPSSDDLPGNVIDLGPPPRPSRTRERPRDLGDQSRRDNDDDDEDNRWLPVARGRSNTPVQYR